MNKPEQSVADQNNAVAQIFDQAREQVAIKDAASQPVKSVDQPIAPHKPEAPFDATKFFDLLGQAEASLEELKSIYKGMGKGKSGLKDELKLAIQSFNREIGKLNGLKDVSFSHEQGVETLKSELAAAVEKYSVQPTVKNKPATVKETKPAVAKKKENELAPLNPEDFYHQKIDLPLKKLKERWDSVNQRLTGELARPENDRYRKIENLFIHFNDLASDYFNEIRKPADQRNIALLANIENEFAEDYVKTVQTIELNGQGGTMRTKRNIHELAAEISFFEERAESKGMLEPEPEKPVKVVANEQPGNGRKARALQEANKLWPSFEDLEAEYNQIIKQFEGLQNQYIDEYDAKLTEAEKQLLAVEIAAVDESFKNAADQAIEFHGKIYGSGNEPIGFDSINKGELLRIKKNFDRKMEVAKNAVAEFLKKLEEVRSETEATVKTDKIEKELAPKQVKTSASELVIIEPTAPKPAVMAVSPTLGRGAITSQEMKALMDTFAVKPAGERPVAHFTEIYREDIFKPYNSLRERFNGLLEPLPQVEQFQNTKAINFIRQTIKELFDLAMSFHEIINGKTMVEHEPFRVNLSKIQEDFANKLAVAQKAVEDLTLAIKTEKEGFQIKEGDWVITKWSTLPVWVAGLPDKKDGTYLVKSSHMDYLPQDQEVKADDILRKVDSKEAQAAWEKLLSQTESPRNKDRAKAMLEFFQAPQIGEQAMIDRVAPRQIEEFLEKRPKFRTGYLVRPVLAGFNAEQLPAITISGEPILFNGEYHYPVKGSNKLIPEAALTSGKGLTVSAESYPEQAAAVIEQLLLDDDKEDSLLIDLIRIKLDEWNRVAAADYFQDSDKIKEAIKEVKSGYKWKTSEQLEKEVKKLEAQKVVLPPQPLTVETAPKTRGPEASKKPKEVEREVVEKFNPRVWYNENISGQYRLLEASFQEILGRLGELPLTSKLLDQVEEFDSLLDVLAEQAKSLAAKVDATPQAELRTVGDDFSEKYQQAETLLRSIEGFIKK